MEFLQRNLMRMRSAPAKFLDFGEQFTYFRAVISRQKVCQLIKTNLMQFLANYANKSRHGRGRECTIYMLAGHLLL